MLFSESDYARKVDNTQRSTKWAVENWESWRKQLNEKNNENVKELSQMSVSELNEWLTRYIHETRRQDGGPYPARSLYLLLYALLRHMRDKGVTDKNFLDEKDERFTSFHDALKKRIEQVANISNDPIKKRLKVSSIDESKLWQTAVLGDATSWTLQNTVFFYNSKLFTIRNVDSHRTLDANQFEIGSDNLGKYVRFIRSINDSNGAKEAEKAPSLSTIFRRKEQSNDIKLYARDMNSRVYHCYEVYLSIVPRHGPFYRRPIKSSGLLSFHSQPVGKNRLAVMLKEMCERADEIYHEFVSKKQVNGSAISLGQRHLPMLLPRPDEPSPSDSPSPTRRNLSNQNSTEDDSTRRSDTMSKRGQGCIECSSSFRSTSTTSNATSNQYPLSTATSSPSTVRSGIFSINGIMNKANSNNEVKPCSHDSAISHSKQDSNISTSINSISDKARTEQDKSSNLVSALSPSDTVDDGNNKLKRQPDRPNNVVQILPITDPKLITLQNGNKIINNTNSTAIILKDSPLNNDNVDQPNTNGKRISDHANNLTDIIVTKKSRIDQDDKQRNSLNFTSMENSLGSSVFDNCDINVYYLGSQTKFRVANFIIGLASLP
ncbi:uncharacterized protein TRIADDRAFT_55556 [Trichoplax adhaerens]|uniref:Uncharacterized protein n=1 Tax=Trichoplax adhaerens TaxID=10228 RepID=B3RV78_TRIAD|nr:hypothetical protein TRIADDRAFT_55556 [Trichoplax adhaerens]EDV25454.1 hypothetical protein TRIADDRAFT_55556 [Trichoplax adhaerens]|eukprot:XP_002111487.1 hypothetical protein TRIADDRAFT_55556 [Trichoplax adhaerens]